MKSLALLFTLLAFPALAAPPVKPTKSRYAPLWLNSPFTVKPIINAPSGPPPVNPMDDYALGGVTKFPDGYFVVLINKKNPAEKKIVQPGVHSEFKVLDVNMGTEKISEEGKMVVEGASVMLANGSMQGEVKYDEKIMAMKGPSVVPQQPGMKPNGGVLVLPPGVNVSSNNNGMGVRQPRLRTIPPPTAPNQPQIPQPQVPQPQIPQLQVPQGSVAQPNALPPSQ